MAETNDTGSFAGHDLGQLLDLGRTLAPGAVVAEPTRLMVRIPVTAGLGRGVRTTVPLVRSAWRGTWALVAATLLLGACTSRNACAPIPPSADCPDITV